MKLNPQTSDCLIEVFNWAKNEFDCARIAGHNISKLCFDLDEPFLNSRRSILLSGLLEDPNVKKNLGLDSLDQYFVREPSYSNEEYLDIILDHLLIWAGLSLSTFERGKLPETFLKDFEQSLNDPWHEVTLIPLFGISITSSFNLKSFKLHKYVEFGIFNYYEKMQLEERAEILSDSYKSPHFKNSFPIVGLRISLPPAERKKSAKEINTTLEAFRVLIRGLFGFDVHYDFQFFGAKTPWCPFDFSQGRHPPKERNSNSNLNYDSRRQSIFENSWTSLNADEIAKYSITAHRLGAMKKRDSWHDHVIDLSIALESLLKSQSEISFKISLFTSIALFDNPDERRQCFKKVKDFYDLRSKIVHGGELPSKFKNMTISDLKKEIAYIEDKVQRLFNLHLTVPSLRTNEGQQDVFLGIRPKIQ